MSPWKRDETLAREERDLVQGARLHPDAPGAPAQDGRSGSDGAGGQRRLAGCLIPLVVLGGVAVGGWQVARQLGLGFGSHSCQFRTGGSEGQWEVEQAANAATITTVGVLRKGLPDHSAQIAIATAIQESKLRNLTYGDRDSIGLFQQRSSQGWGSNAQIADPVYSSTAFYDALTKVPDWQTRPVTEVAQAVQRSGHPNAYADHEGEAGIIAGPLTGAQPGGVGCRMEPASTAKAPGEVAEKLRLQTGLRTSINDRAITVRAPSAKDGWAVGSWAVTHAEAEGITRVVVGEREWVRQRGSAGWDWHPADSPTRSARTVRITLA